MIKAFHQAELAQKRGEVPIGAVLVDTETKQILAADGNRTIELKDPSAHAEMLVIRKGCQVRGSERLEGCDLYVTIEPCPMCATAISFARVRRLYFGAEDEKMGGVMNGPRIFTSTSCHHKPEVFDGMGAGRAKKIMQEFFQQKR
jgi:tRNA(Arg) A34 adenosine deaminase TadA